MTQVNVVEYGPNRNGLGTTRHDHRALTPINHILERLSPLKLPEKEHFESYLWKFWREWTTAWSGKMEIRCTGGSC